MKNIFIFIIPVLSVFSCNTGNSPVELIYNGNFDLGTLNWNIFGYASFEVVSEEAHIIINNPGSNIDDISFYYTDGLDFINDSNYRISFTSYTTGSRSIQLRIVSSIVGPIFSIVDKTIVLNNSSTQYSYNFTSAYDSNLGGLIFACGNDADEIYLDNISLLKY